MSNKPQTPEQINRIRRQTQCGNCLYSNWDYSFNDFFWCDIGMTEPDKPIWHCENDCTHLDTGISWP